MNPTFHFLFIPDSSIATLKNSYLLNDSLRRSPHRLTNDWRTHCCRVKRCLKFLMEYKNELPHRELTSLSRFYLKLSAPSLNGLFWLYLRWVRTVLRVVFRLSSPTHKHSYHQPELLNSGVTSVIYSSLAELHRIRPVQKGSRHF